MLNNASATRNVNALVSQIAVLTFLAVSSKMPADRACTCLLGAPAVANRDSYLEISAEAAVNKYANIPFFHVLTMGDVTILGVVSRPMLLAVHSDAASRLRITKPKDHEWNGESTGAISYDEPNII